MRPPLGPGGSLSCLAVFSGIGDWSLARIARTNAPFSSLAKGGQGGVISAPSSAAIADEQRQTSTNALHTIAEREV